MQLTRFGGTGDKHLVILHATGFLAAVYQPLAASLTKSYVVWGLDLPGHGTSASVAAAGSAGASDSSSRQAPGKDTPLSPGSSPSINLRFLVQELVATLQQAGLQGCYAFGHSAGGALALLAASSCPRLFSAIYCFEAVVSTPASHAFMATASANGDITTDGQRLANMARKRRATFSSKQAAMQHLTGKPPFSRLDPRVVALYAAYGLNETGPQQQGWRQQQQQQRPAVGAVQALADTTGQSGNLTQQEQHQQHMASTAAASSGAAAQHTASEKCTVLPQPLQQGQQARQQHGQQQSLQHPVQLVCAPWQEAAYFDALHPPPAVDPGSITCPVLLAVAAPAAGGDSTPAAALASHAGVQAWFLEHSREHSRQLHGSLRVLNCELAAAMASAQLAEIQGVSHFGPLEQPELLAASCESFFRTTPCWQQQQQQQHRSPAGHCGERLPSKL